MRPLLVVVLHVGPQNPIKVPGAKDQQPVQAVREQRLYPALGERVRVRCPDDVLSTGMLMRWMRVSARPLASGARPAGRGPVGCKYSIMPRSRTRG